jgi:DNA-binding SARP family transcriptional activator
MTAQVKLSRGTQALLAYLLPQPHPVPRDVLADVFWEEHAPDQARSNLNTAIWRLRQALEPDGVQSQTYLISTRSCYALCDPEYDKLGAWNEKPIRAT